MENLMEQMIKVELKVTIIVINLNYSVNILSYEWTGTE